MTTEYNSTTEDLLAHARNAMQIAENTERKILGANRPTLKEPHFTYAVSQPTMSPPPSFGELFGTDTTASTVSWLQQQIDGWLANYFPSISGGLKSIPDQWLADVIGGVTPLGHSQTYFDRVWHQARDRAYRTRRSETDSIAESFAARGFTLPPGAMVAALDEAQQRASDSILEVNREQALKDADIKLDLLKFAEEQALRYKQGIMQALSDFHRQWSTLPDKDVEKARVRAQANASLYSALSSYYNVEAAYEQLRLRAAESKIEVEGNIDDRRIKLFGTDNNANTALGAAVRGFADISAGAAGSAGSLVAHIEAT